MAIQTKLDSNITETRYSAETSFGVADGSAVWKIIEPNSFSEARGQFAKVARNPIASDRQRKKGVTVDLDAQIGWNQDLQHYSTQDLLQGLFYATARSKTNFGGTGQLVSVNGSNQITAASGLGVFAVGALVVLRNGTQTAGNSNRVLRVTVSTATALTFAETLVAETLPATALLVQVGVRTAAGDIDVDASGALPVLTSTTLNFSTLGLVPGEHIWIGGDAALTFFSGNAANNCLARVRSVSANAVVLDKASKGAMVTEANTADTVEIYTGRVLKNEQSALQVRRTYQFERQLGAPDDSQPTQIQSEYFTGCVFNEAVLNLDTASKITMDMKFLSADQELRTGVTGLKAGTRPAIENADAQNTSTDLKRVRLAKVITGNESPDPLFAFFPSATITFNNGVEPLKAITRLGAFEMSAADFVVTVSLNGYFSSIEAISAIRDNDTLTLDLMEFRNNQGWVIDLPLVTAGDGSIQVEKDKPLMTPLTLECASGEEVDSNLDYTACWTFFDGLPDRAATPNAA
jgi:hypothetical protein